MPCGTSGVSILVTHACVGVRHACLIVPYVCLIVLHACLVVPHACLRDAHNFDISASNAGIIDNICWRDRDGASLIDKYRPHLHILSGSSTYKYNGSKGSIKY